MFKKFMTYLFRWQLSTPVLAPVLAYFSGSCGAWGATAIGNLIGGCIFFWIDRYIFRVKYKRPLWEIQDGTRCTDCGKTARCYRLAKAGRYDRLDDNRPEFRCEKCSQEKLRQLENQGVKLA